MALVAMFSLLSSSCKDDDERLDNTDLLIGVWVTKDDVTLFFDDKSEWAHGKVYFQFNEDGTMIEKDALTRFDNGDTFVKTSTFGEWKADGDKLTMTTSFSDDIDDIPDVNIVTYKLKKHSLIITYTNEWGEQVSWTFVRGEMPKEETAEE